MTLQLVLLEHQPHTGVNHGQASHHADSAREVFSFYLYMFAASQKILDVSTASNKHKLQIAVCHTRQALNPCNAVAG